MRDQCGVVAEQAAAFVLGALTADEARAVREHLATCPEPHHEFEALGGVVPYLAESVPLVEPPAALKGRILAAAASDLARRQAVAMPHRPAIVPPAHTSEPRRLPRPSVGWAAALAAVLVIAVLGGWNLALQRDLDRTRQDEAGLAAVLEIAGEAGSQTAILTGEGADQPTGLAALGRDGRVAIVMRGLPATTGSEVYEAWVIGGDGVPVPIGGFRAGATGDATFLAGGVRAEAGVTLALTREPGPGSTAPTLPIVSAGQAVAAGS